MDTPEVTTRVRPFGLAILAVGAAGAGRAHAVVHLQAPGAGRPGRLNKDAGSGSLTMPTRAVSLSHPGRGRIDVLPHSAQAER